MKSEELLTGLSEVGEDLLAETESGIRVSTRRPWVGGAIAAGLALLIGLGGLTFWQVRKHRREAAAEAATVIMPGPEAEALEQFYVDRNWRGESAWTFDNLERSLRVNRWTLETGADRLPVYEVPTTHPAMEGWTWEGGMEQSLRGILNEAAARLGLPAPEDVRIQEEGGEIAWVEADTEMGVLTVYLNGTVRILLNEEHWLTATVKLDFAEELTEWERDAEYRDAVMEACGEQVEALLGLPACHPAVCDRYSSLSSNYTAYILYPIREDPAEQLKSRYFEQVRMLTVGGNSVMGLEWERLPEAGGTCAVPEDWRCMGNYPIISLDAAKEAVLQGAYYIDTRTNTVHPPVAEENLAWGELVYLPGAEDVSILLPFYRFWVPCREGEVTSLMSAMAIYVPAVDPDYLIDYPEQMPVVIDDPELAPFAVGEDYLNTTDESGIAIIDLSTMNYLESPGTSLPTPLWGDLAERYDTLPVYRYLAVGERYLTRGRMEELGTEAAELLGMEIDEFAYYQEDMDQPVAAPGPNETLGTLTVKLKNGGLIWVRWNGQIIFISPSAISAEETIDSGDPNAVFAVFARQLLQLEHTEDYSAQFGVGPSHPNLYFSPLRTDEKQTLLAYHFETSFFSMTDDSSVAALCCCVLPQRNMDPTAPCQPGEAFELMGEYPIIKRDEARELAAKGYYYSTNEALDDTISHDPVFYRQGEIRDFTLCAAEDAELVYPATALGLSEHETVLPFYRFWFVAGEGTDSMEAYPVYVPAIDPAYLTDFPSAGSTDPAPDDPGIEETDGPNGQDPAALPVLSLANCFGNNGEEGKLFRDPNNEIALSPISDFTMDLPRELPVYQNMAYVDESGIPVYLAREEMQLRADALVQRWKLQVQREEWIDGALRPEDPAGTVPNPSALTVETDKATVTVYGNGECLVTFREPLDKDTELAAEWVFDPAAPLTPESAAAYAKAWAEYCEMGCSGLQVQCEPVYGYADMEARTYTCVYYLTEPARDDEAARLEQRLLEYTFHEQLYMDENGNLTGYRTHLVPPSAVSSCYAAEAVGTYPILSKAEADQALKNGFFFTNASMPVFRNGKPLGEALLAHTVAAELVYRTGNDRYFLPYYRYWVVGDVRETAGGLTQCGAVYVPAIPEEYLTDWPEYLMPGRVSDDELAELQALFEDENSWYGRILRCGAFPAPDLVPLGNLLRAGLPGVDNTLSDEERAELEAAATAEQLDTGVEPVKLPKQTLNDLLQSALGLTLDQIQYNDLRDWVYLEDRDCFYLFAGDPGGIIIEVESYLARSDNELQLRYWRLEDGRDTPVMYVANLQKTGDGYLVLSNEPAEWNN